MRADDGFVGHGVVAPFGPDLVEWYNFLSSGSVAKCRWVSYCQVTNSVCEAAGGAGRIRGGGRSPVWVRAHRDGVSPPVLKSG